MSYQGIYKGYSLFWPSDRSTFWAIAPDGTKTENFATVQLLTSWIDVHSQDSKQQGQEVTSQAVTATKADVDNQKLWIEEKNILVPWMRKLQIATKAYDVAQAGEASGPLDTITGAILPWNSIEISKVHGVADVDKDFYIAQRHTAFSPLENGVTFENLVLLIGAVLMGRGAEGRKSLERIIIKYLDSCTKIVESIQDASHVNWHVAINNQYLTNAIGHRLGLIDDGAYLKINSHYDDFIDKMVKIEAVTGTLDSVATFVGGTKFSSSSREEGMYGASEKMSTTGLGGLAATIKALEK